MKISERLRERLVGLGYTGIGEVERLYPGYWQRSAGAWVWCANYHGVDLGSIYRMGECVKLTNDELRDVLES